MEPPPGQQSPASLRTRARARLSRRPTLPDLVAGAIFAVAGSLFVTGAIAGAQGDIRNDRTGGLRDSIAERADDAHALADDVERYRGQLETLRLQEADRPKVETIENEISELQPAVGLTEVVGPGVTVELNDAVAPDPLPEGMTGDDYIVHQQDIQGVINAMWRGGASGVTVMGVRLISTSAVRCVGNTVILQGRVHSPPFVITGVGDPAALRLSLAAEPSVQIFRQWVDLVGLGYREIAFVKETLPPYSGPLTMKHATVAK
ncbi:MAG: DUF881 domain-containing protein [Candidatus Nanopelagicales bacterium]